MEDVPNQDEDMAEIYDLWHRLELAGGMEAEAEIGDFLMAEDEFQGEPFLFFPFQFFTFSDYPTEDLLMDESQSVNMEEDILGSTSQHDGIDYLAYEELLDEEPRDISYHHDPIDWDSMYE